MRQAPWTVISGKMEKPTKFTSLWFETLVECKTSIAKRKEEKACISWEEKKAQHPLQNKIADFLDLPPASQQGPSSRQNLTVPGTAWVLLPAHPDWVSFAKLAQLEVPRVSLISGLALSVSV